MEGAVVRPDKRGLADAVESKKQLNSCEFELEEADHFIAPIFKNGNYIGTGTFKLMELLDDDNSKEVFGAA